MIPINKLHATESFLISQQSLSWSRNSLPFMERKYLLPCS